LFPDFDHYVLSILLFIPLDNDVKIFDPSIRLALLVIGGNKAVGP
jgi:hypothetical protein